MTEKLYVRQLTTRSHCGNCHGNLTLVCPDDPGPNDPFLYICWECKRIVQAGVGEVEEEVGTLGDGFVEIKK